ncbi:MAG: DUF3298 and DUF4163 domain-containing protein [Tannerellaceae bacterium]|nr:DUF3298 and DUF4163 domain-containing protein [Tannerellaceae bacterium]
MIISLICLSGCKPKAAGTAKSDIEYKSILLSHFAHFFDNTDNPSSELKVSFLYPASGLNPELLEKLQALFVTEFFGENYAGLSPDEAAGKYKEQYLLFYKEQENLFKEESERLPDAEHAEHDDDLFDEVSQTAYSYYEMKENAVKFDNASILSFAVSVENYSGGAHGSHSYICCNVDLLSGKKIEEKDVFVDGFEARMAAILVARLVKDNKLSDAKELEEIGFFSVDEISPNNNFEINDKGIIYYFNEYEIAPYAAGLIAVPVSFAELRALLRPDSMLEALF